jgi:hypothetical protein
MNAQWTARIAAIVNPPTKFAGWRSIFAPSLVRRARWTRESTHACQLVFFSPSRECTAAMTAEHKSLESPLVTKPIRAPG